MGLRPAKTCREVSGQAWARISRKKPRKSFVKGAPKPKIRQYNMGSDKRYEIEATLVAVSEIQVRDNALEAARQAINRGLEKNLYQNYFFQVTAYPHLVLREHTTLGVAGADRISKGMKRAFGRPKGRTAKIRKGGVAFTVRAMGKDLKVVKEALKKGQLKISGTFTVKVRDISSDQINMARKEHVFKKQEEEKKVETPAAETATKEGKEGGKEEKKADEKKEEKKEEKKK